MQRKPTPRTLAAAFLALSAALAVAVLAVRNLYDDELFSLYLVTGSARDIFRITAHGDVHPPGMYLLAHLAYLTLPSFRWMNLFPILVLYTGLAVFLFEVAPLFLRIRAQLCLLLLATLHPQLLLWGATFRWYSWWTGLALIALTIALQPRESRPTLGVARALTLGLLLAGLFYLNYIAFLFLVALAPAMFLRYRTQPWKPLLTRAFLIAGVFFLLIAPQLHTLFTVHLPEGRAQRYGMAMSCLRLLQSIAASEAYLPWHPLAILATLLFAGLCIAGWVHLVTKSPRSGIRPSPQAPLRSFDLASIALFGLLFLLLVAATGLGGRPRNGLLLIPVLAPTAALIVETLRPRTQTAILIFFALWSAVGISHLFGRHGLAKSAMNDRPEQVVAFVERGVASGCVVVVTYDSALAFELAHEARLHSTLIISPYRGPIFGGDRTLPPEGCAHPRLYAVQSYLSGRAHRVEAVNRELQIAEQYIEGPPSLDSFSPDPDARLKRRLAQLPGLGSDLQSMAALPDYRYIVASGPIDRANIEPMRRRMAHFVSGYDTTPDQIPDHPEP